MDEADQKQYTCKYCGDYTSDNAAKVRGHQMTCKNKIARLDETMKKHRDLEAAEEAAEAALEVDQYKNPMMGDTPDPDPSARARQIRRQRTEFGQPRMSHEGFPDDGFHYHIFNDNWQRNPNRVKDMIAKGYEVVQGEPEQHRGTNDDGSSIKGITMRIPKEIYEEDQRAKQREVDLVDEAINRGKFEEGPGDNRYVPDGIRIHSDTREPA